MLGSGGSLNTEVLNCQQPCENDAIKEVPERKSLESSSGSMCEDKETCPFFLDVEYESELASSVCWSSFILCFSFSHR